MNAVAGAAEQLKSRLEMLGGLFREAALVLGLTAEEAQRAAEDCGMTLAGAQLSFLPSVDESALVIMADAGVDTLDTIERKRTALECSLAMVMGVGMSVGHDGSRTVLSYRWPIEEDAVGELAQAIAGVAAVATGLRQLGVEALAEGMASVPAGEAI